MENVIAESIRRISIERPAHVAVATADATISYAELVERWDTATRTLRDIGINAGDRVLLRATNHADMFAMILACMSRGAVAVPVFARATEERVEQLHAILGATAVATAPTSMSRLEQTADAPAIPADVHTLIMTSGTTGVPKAVPIHVGMSNMGASNINELFEFRAGSTFLNYTPFSTVGGLYLAGLPQLAYGVTQICLGFAPLEFGAVLARYKPSHVVMLPVMINVLRSLDSWSRLDLSCFDVLMMGSAPVLDHHGRDALSRGVKRFVHAYGSTECQPPVIMRESRTIDAEEILGLHQFLGDWEHRFTPEGELMLRGSAMTRGYINRPPGTSFEDGWFRTGDLFSRNEHGMRFIGRADQRLKVNAWSVSPELTEGVIMEDPGVNACVVVKKVGRSGAESLVAMVSGPAVDPQAILARCRARLDDHQVPRRVVEVPQVPLNAMGKVDRVAAAAL